MKLAVIILSLLLVLSITYNFIQTSTHEAIEANERKARIYHQSRADSITALYSDLMERDTVQAILYANAMERAQNAEKRYLKAEGDLRRERAINRKFTDVESDSLLSLVR